MHACLVHRHLCFLPGLARADKPFWWDPSRRVAFPQPKRTPLFTGIPCGHMSVIVGFLKTFCVFRIVIAEKVFAFFFFIIKPGFYCLSQESSLAESIMCWGQWAFFPWYCLFTGCLGSHLCSLHLTCTLLLPCFILSSLWPILVYALFYLSGSQIKPAFYSRHDVFFFSRPVYSRDFFSERSCSRVWLCSRVAFSSGLQCFSAMPTRSGVSHMN